ncbi:aldehyde dehydrogenase family protein [Peribacillus muralis]|uniref:aldehyde dehydrogenase family protein n=1 Tax=Peribacillus muralis TaxID=264697 RepID=UPI001F4DFD63|nr:aldehyde dehydrogenase family protein [Peribacillus muralis]MCK1993256.1 aldehyde dehydrogenase family protein [Peribacillus muralis]MCK2013810.1 aldehyde dehydrogenase family protein [Peribacillus muralis]
MTQATKQFEGIEQPKLEWAQEWLKTTKKLYINGKWVDSSGNNVIESINPANGEILGAFQSAEAQDVDVAIQAARTALGHGSWKDMSRKDRAKALRKISNLIHEHHAELATLEALDNGKLYTEAYNDDVQEAADLFEYYAGWTDKYYGENNPVEGNFLSVTTRDPIGVCGQIVPFNFPIQMAVLKLSPALSMGNTVILKPADKTSYSAIRLFEIIDEAGVLPKGVINLVLGDGEVGSYISRHMDIDKLSFTGSTNIGKKLIHDSADSNLKPVTLELGGKSPNIIFSDFRDLDAAIERSFYGLFTHKGEKCSAPTRLFAQREIYDEVVEKIAGYAKNYKCGDPFNPASDQGATVSKQHMESILHYIESGKEQGARIVAGGERDTTGTNAKGCFVQPTIFADVDNSMKIAQEEIFGPVLCIIPFDTEEEVIQKANDTIYGLGAGLWTDDASRAHRVANQLEAGMVFVNKYGCYDFSSPFGGLKQSGWGKEYAIHSLQAFTKTKAIWFAY